MQIIKAAGIVLGAKLTKAEEEALNIEAKKVVAEYTRNITTEIDAEFLWVLHDVCGFGEKRLKDVFMAYAPRLKALCDHYEMNDDGDSGYLCSAKLKDLGVNIEEWEEESRKRNLL